MKTFLVILLFSSLSALAQSGTVGIAWDSTITPAKFTLYQQPQGSTARVKLVDNIPGNQRSISISCTNNVWYTLTMTATTTVGSSSQESPQSNVIQFQFIVPPAPTIRLQ